MPDPQERLIIQQVKDEQYQAACTRRHLYKSLEEEFNKPVIAFFGSFRYPVMIEDSDADMLEGICQKSDLTRGLVLMISSPGGDGLAAERITNICRSYSATGEYDAIIPGKAKSAATMICLGAAKLIMSPTSELGSIDPQIAIMKDGQLKRFSVYNVVKSYKELFAKAVREKGKLEPYLQQLANYDAKEIKEFEAALELSEDIAVKALRTGMLSKLSERTIRQRISSLLTPEKVKVHGRPIYADDAQKCGLKVKLMDIREKAWTRVSELHARLNNYVSSNNVAKCIESRDYSYSAVCEA